MKKLTCQLLSLLCIGLFSGCSFLGPCESGSGSASEDKTPSWVEKTNAPEGYTEALFDRRYNYGVNILGLNNYHTVLPWAKIYPHGEQELDPYWRLAQWGYYNNYFLQKDASYTETNGVINYTKNWTEPVKDGDWITISNKASTVSLNIATGGFKLYTDVREEYGVTPPYATHPIISNPRRAGEDWPHLLMEQAIPCPLTLGDITATYFDIAFTVEKAENHTPNYNTSLHTAQFSWIFTISCVNRSSPSYGKGYFFSLPLYDYRTKIIPASFMVDSGKESATGDMMYGLCNEDMVKGGVEVGTRYECSVNLYEQLKASFERMQGDGNFNNCTLSDMRINTTNIGWELPGTFDVGLEVEYISLKYIEKE